MWKTLREDSSVAPANSLVQNKQKAMYSATLDVLREIADDVREGMLETVGVDCELSLDSGRCSVVLKLSPEADTKIIAEAIALENADAWCDERRRIHLGISPWFSTKDVDQTVLCAVKVIHVLLGLHAVCETRPKTFKQRLFQSIADILTVQKEIKRNNMSAANGFDRQTIKTD